MEYVEVELICKTCKEPFTYKRSCHNALEAEILEYKAVHRRKPICPACLKKEQDAAELAKAAEMGLPILMGRSEKQISYALSLRNRYISQHPSALKAAQRNLALTTPHS